FARDEAAPLTPDIVPGEPELAGWTRDETRLVYTFNPAVFLRVLSANREVELAGLPLVDVARAGELLGDEEPRAVLLGILAACVRLTKRSGATAPRSIAWITTSSTSTPRRRSLLRRRTSCRGTSPTDIASSPPISSAEPSGSSGITSVPATRSASNTMGWCGL